MCFVTLSLYCIQQTLTTQQYLQHIRRGPLQYHNLYIPYFRFGEDGACGLEAWMQSSDTGVISSEGGIDANSIFKTNSSGKETIADGEAQELVLDKSLPKWQTWLQVETFRQHAHVMPWQPNKSAGETEEDCEDPERLVLFDDISSGLFKLKDPKHKLSLVLHFLEFLGVPVPCLQPTTSSDVQRYFSICTEHKDQLLKACLPLYPQCLGLKKFSEWTGGINSLLCPGTVWPSPQLVHLTRNIFEQLLLMFDGEIKSLLMVLWLCFEFYLCQLQQTPKGKKQKYKDVRRLAKALLKQPNNRCNKILISDTTLLGFPFIKVYPFDGGPPLLGLR